MRIEKYNKPLLSYEQVVRIINERIAQDEVKSVSDVRIVRVEKAATEVKQMERKVDYEINLKSWILNLKPI